MTTLKRMNTDKIVFDVHHCSFLFVKSTTQVNYLATDCQTQSPSVPMAYRYDHIEMHEHRWNCICRILLSVFVYQPISIFWGPVVYFKATILCNYFMDNHLCWYSSGNRWLTFKKHWFNQNLQAQHLSVAIPWENYCPHSLKPRSSRPTAVLQALLAENRKYQIVFVTCRIQQV